MALLAVDVWYDSSFFNYRLVLTSSQRQYLYSEFVNKVFVWWYSCLILILLQVSVVDELGIPVKFVGVGEGVDDLQPFDAEAFVNAIFSWLSRLNQAYDEALYGCLRIAQSLAVPHCHFSDGSVLCNLDVLESWRPPYIISQRLFSEAVHIWTLFGNFVMKWCICARDRLVLFYVLLMQTRPAALSTVLSFLVHSLLLRVLTQLNTSVSFILSFLAFNSINDSKYHLIAPFNLRLGVLKIGLIDNLIYVSFLAELKFNLVSLTSIYFVDGRQKYQ